MKVLYNAEWPERITAWLEGSGAGSFRLVNTRRKGTKYLIELEARCNAGAPKRYMAKVTKDGRSRRSFHALQHLWNAGFRPPSPFTVVRPIAYYSDPDLLLQEKAEGRHLGEILFGSNGNPAISLGRTAQWLATLQEADVPAEPRSPKIAESLRRYGRELAELLPSFQFRIEPLVTRGLAVVNEASSLVPSHGDLHPKNVFIDAMEQVTVIDLDTFGQQPPEADVAYFLAQTAIMGHFHLGSFSATALSRAEFLKVYRSIAAPLSCSRLAAYLGMAFLQSLHYELCVFHTGNTSLIGPWLHISERGLLHGEVDLLDAHGAMA